MDDVLIDASASAIDGSGGILGQAGPDRFRSGTSIPYHGVMQFDSADLASLEASGQLSSVVLHEMGHVLGIGTIWQNRGLITGAGTANPRFVGINATAQYNAIFGRNETGVPVENSGGSGTADSHWRESVFNNEVMTGYLNSGFNPLSRITIGSLADLGYTVDYSRADNYSPPAGSLLGGSGGGGGSGAGLRSGNFVSIAADWATQDRTTMTSTCEDSTQPCTDPVMASSDTDMEPVMHGTEVRTPTTNTTHTNPTPRFRGFHRNLTGRRIGADDLNGFSAQLTESIHPIQASYLPDAGVGGFMPRMDQFILAQFPSGLGDLWRRLRSWATLH